MCQNEQTQVQTQSRQAYWKSGPLRLGGAALALAISGSIAWAQWDPGKTFDEIITGEKPIDQQIDQGLQRVHPHYKTNKFELVAKQENGGWVLAWSKDITETDAINGVVAAGISIYTGGAAFSLWVSELVDRTINSVADSGRRRFPEYVRVQSKELAQQVIYAAIQGKSPQQALKNFDTVDFKAGAIRYTGGNYVGDQLVGPHTWGMKIYLGFRVRPSGQGTASGQGAGHPQAAAVGLGGPFSFYRQQDRPEVYLVWYRSGFFCHVRNPEQMNAYGGFGKVQVVERLNLNRANFKGECPNP